MTRDRGFGIAGALDHAIVERLAVAAEAAGYATFWANDTPVGDGLTALARAANATSSIRLGVGVIPIDRKPADVIARQIVELGLPEDRLIVGIGSGGMTHGAIDAVREAALSLRESTSARITIGALGPRMCELAGESSDGALLNWLMPSYVPHLAAVVKRGAAAYQRPTPWIAAYVRVALAGPAETRLRAEAERYAGYPAYAAHFARMEVDAIETCVLGDAERIQHGLAAFQPFVDEVVVRAIAAEETLADYLDVMRVSAPAWDE
ncbi:MAG: LLM class flavin-dependent oxidoreductase [Thermomicrobiales bacterium]|nr:LLM class flavin-dependent oxidoreductase [Thermomicrobiales bacterium]